MKWFLHDLAFPFTLSFYTVWLLFPTKAWHVITIHLHDNHNFSCNFIHYNVHTGMLLYRIIDKIHQTHEQNK